MRFLNILFAVIYLCLQLGEPTRSAAQDWADSVEHKVAHNVQLFGQAIVQLSETASSGTKKDKSGDVPPLLGDLLSLLPQVSTAQLANYSGQPHTYYLSVAQLLASPRAPPVLA